MPPRRSPRSPHRGADVPGRVVRYDPARVAALRQRALLAADDLAGIVSDDPAASTAVRTAGAARTNLEAGWLPLLGRVLADQAMSTWTTSALGDLLGRWSELLSWFTARHGPDLGRGLAATAREVVADGDVEDIADLAAALLGAGSDTAAMRTFFAELGGDGVAELLMYLGTEVEHADEALDLAGALRTRLAESSARPGFPATFPAELVERFIVETEDDRAQPGRRHGLPVRRHQLRHGLPRRHDPRPRRP